MINDLVQEIKETMDANGYVFFDNDKAYNLNIIGLRNKEQHPNEFDDLLILVYKDLGKRWNVRMYPITTDAGIYWLKNPMNYKGTASLKEGQYSSTWKIGKHKGKYDALVQCKQVQVYRDNDKDKIFDYEDAVIYTGYFGINIHRSHPRTEKVKVNTYSAGCQVFANPDDFKDFMRIIKVSAQRFGNSFTYTLIRR